MRADEGPVSRRESDRREWLIAWALALVLHVGAILGLGSLRLPAPSPPDMPEPVDLVILPETPEQPRFFSEQPADRADADPENPDFLSNVASRARDLAPEGDAALPRMSGESDAPTVKLDPNQASSQPSATSPSTPPLDPLNRDAGVEPFTRHQPHPDFGPASDAALRGPSGATGNSDIRQPEMDNPDGNAGLTGDVSLSTTDWDYSPWLQRFGRELMRRWIAPPAYTMGLLKDGGWAVIDLEIARSGKVLRVELRDQHGHQTLILSAQSAVRAMNPVEPLPADFPEQTLILRLRMVYPRYGSQPTRRTVRSR